MLSNVLLIVESHWNEGTISCSVSTHPGKIMGHIDLDLDAWETLRDIARDSAGAVKVLTRDEFEHMDRATGVVSR